MRKNKTAPTKKGINKRKKKRCDDVKCLSTLIAYPSMRKLFPMTERKQTESSKNRTVIANESLC